MFNELDDDTLDVQLNWNLFSTIAGRPTLYKFGPSYVYRTRDFASRRFRFIPTNFRAINLAQTPEALFASQNVGVDFRFNEETRPVDAYDAEQKTLGAYGMADVTLGARARLIAGLRVEDFDLEVNTFDPFGLFLATVQARVQETDLFPSVNYVHSLRPDMNLRAGYSRTTNRPEFRELAAFEFTDVVGNRSIRGNPDLRPAMINNIDGRWEWFSGGREVVAASVFYKHFDDPIERVIIAGAQPAATFQNAQSARNFGIELELARELGRHFFVSANYTYVDSEITLNQEAQRVQTSLVRPLAGQSGNLFNLMGEVAWRGLQARALYNYFGDRISDVGANGAPDVVEQGRGSFDIVLIQRFGNVGLRLTLENLTDSEYLFTQGPLDQRYYKTGRSISFGFAYSFF
jgi:TonB-dependent receptor